MVFDREFIVQMFGEFGLDITHRVVGKITGKTAGKAQRTVDWCRLEAVAIFFNKNERVIDKLVLGLLACPADFGTDHGNLAAANFEPLARRQADDGIAPGALPADHGFEQIGMRPIGKLEIKRQRRIEIRKCLQGYRDSVIAERGETLEVGFGHDVSCKYGWTGTTGHNRGARGSAPALPPPPRNRICENTHDQREKKKRIGKAC